MSWINNGMLNPTNLNRSTIYLDHPLDYAAAVIPYLKFMLHPIIHPKNSPNIEYTYT
jgi:hypothetical protein